MSIREHLAFWAVGIGSAIIFLYLFSPILLPFVAGLIVAFMLDPLADKLESWGLGRNASTALLTLGFIIIVAGVLTFLLPVAYSQFMQLAKNMPGNVEKISALAEPWLAKAGIELQGSFIEEAKTIAKEHFKELAGTAGAFGKGLMKGGMAVLGIASLLVITPIVTFYIIREWDIMVARVDSWLPRQHQETIRKLFRETDKVLSSFIRGQLTICLILGAIYATALTIAGLEGGLLIGLATGALAFITYVGSMIGMAVAIIMAIVQFQDAAMVGIIAGIFVVIQLIEGKILVPLLVGEKVGLHPVWVIFALMGGGAVMGLTGILIAIPVAAVIGVGVRFGMDQYLQSRFYNTGTK